MVTYAAQPGAPGGSAVTVVAAACADARSVRRAEVALGDLWAGGSVELLDGSVYEWPLGGLRPWWRAVENVARTNPLPSRAWEVVTDRLVGWGSGSSVLPEGVRLRPGGSLVIAFLSEVSEPVDLGATAASSTSTTTIARVDFETLLAAGPAA